ncbi:MAG: hypothetical protein CMI67_00670 [Pelagibaca sp.]|nr:hypothetical protein [Pelagibaca sp.]
MPIGGHDWLPIDRQEVASGFRDALLAFGMPVVILGGILSGAFTATEAAAVAVVYAAILGFVVYRNLTLAIVGELLTRTAIATGGLLLIAATGYLFAWIMAAEQIPSRAAQIMLAISENPVAFLLMVNLLLLVLGTFMDTLAALIIVVPMLSPVAVQVGIDPVHFGVVVCFRPGSSAGRPATAGRRALRGWSCQRERTWARAALPVLRHRAG